MTQSPSVPVPPAPKSPHRNRTAGIAAALVIGLLIGLVLGILISPTIQPTQNDNGGNPNMAPNTQVTVSGTITNIDQYVQVTFTQIVFVNLNQTITSSAQISASGAYSILLVAGQSYLVQIEDSGGDSSTASLYVPTGVTTFTHNFSVDFNF
jgi:hypothetical protein